MVAGMPANFPTREQITAAHSLIEGYIRRTPVINVTLPSGQGVTLKLELLQHTSSFKPRGAFFNALSASERPTSLVAASGGNHGLAVAHVGQELGIPARIFVPTTAPAVKVERLGRLGAQVNQIGTRYAEALEASKAAAGEAGALAIHAYDTMATVTGQGSIGLEIEEQTRPGTVLVAVGGGGLIGGVSSWFVGQRKIVAVEPHGCPTMHTALAAGWPVPVNPSGLAADSLGASVIGEVGFAAAQAAEVISVLIEEDAIRAAQTWLWDEVRIAAEPGGAVALAALMSGAYRPAEGEEITVIVCGGNG